MRFLSAAVALLLLTAQALAQCPTVGPQTVNPPNVVSGIDPNCVVTTRQLNFTADLLFAPPFGISASSSNGATIEYGQVTMYPDYDPGFAVNQAVQITSPQDPQALMVGVITTYSNSGGMTTLTVDVEQLFGETATLTAWNIQVIGMPSGTIPRSASWSIDYTTSFALPAAGTTRALTVGTGKGFIAGAQVYVQATLDATTYIFGIVQNYNTSTGALNIYVTQSSGTGLTYQLWTVSMTGNLAPFVPILGFSGTSLTYGSGASQIGVGQVVTMTTQTGLLLNNSHIVVSSSTDSTQYFRGIGQYNSGTGAITIYITDVSGSGTISSWSLFAQDGPPVNADQIAVSTSSATLGAGDFTFTIQSGQNFPIQGPVTLTALASQTNQMLGVIKAYSGTSLIVTVPSTGVYGSGTFTAWSILNTGPPQTRISLYQMNGLNVIGTSDRAFTVAKGSVRDSADTVDLTLAAGVTVDLTTTTNLVQPQLAGTVSTAGFSTAITGAGTAFTTDFSTAGTLTDLNNQLSNIGSPTVSFPVIIFFTGGSISHYIVSVTNNTNLSIDSTVSLGGGTTYFRNGVLSNTAGLHYGIILTRKDSDGSTAIYVSSFTVSGVPDLPSGYTYFRVIAYVTAETNAGTMVVSQPLFSISGGSPGQSLVSNGIVFLPSNLGPKAVYSATITPTPVTGSVSSVNAGTDVITWSTNHLLTTGQTVRGIGTVPTGFTVGQVFYVNALSATTFSLYTTYANAIADTSRVDITTTTTGATMVKYVASSEFNIGGTTISAIAGTPGATSMAWDINLSNALASTAGACNWNFNSVIDTAAGTVLNWVQRTFETYTSTTLVQLPNGSIIGATAGNLPGTWVQQALTPYKTKVWCWGALDEPIPANDNDLIARAVA